MLTNDLRFIDSHAHPALIPDTEREEEFRDMATANVVALIAPATGFTSNSANYRKLEDYPNVAFAFGLHPKYIGKFPKTAYIKEPLGAGFQQLDRSLSDQLLFSNTIQEQLDLIEKMLAKYEDRVVGVGECGLDYSIHPSSQERMLQIAVFRRQIIMALHHRPRLALICHIREGKDYEYSANKDAYNILKSFHCSYEGMGVVHCFCTGTEDARRYLSLGLALGLGGSVTYADNTQLQEAVRKLPLSGFVLETDAPYVKPTGIPGERNSSAYIPYICQRIAELRKEDMDITAAAAWDNTLRQFPLLQRAISSGDSITANDSIIST